MEIGDYKVEQDYYPDILYDTYGHPEREIWSTVPVADATPERGSRIYHLLSTHKVEGFEERAFFQVTYVYPDGETRRGNTLKVCALSLFKRRAAP